MSNPIPPNYPTWQESPITLPAIILDPFGTQVAIASDGAVKVLGAYPSKLTTIFNDPYSGIILAVDTDGAIRLLSPSPSEETSIIWGPLNLGLLVDIDNAVRVRGASQISGWQESPIPPNYPGWSENPI